MTAQRLLDVLQWSGFIGVAGAYWFYVTKPRLATMLTLAGCVGLLMWAMLNQPILWGIAALETSVIAMTVRNMQQLDAKGPQ